MSTGVVEFYLGEVNTRDRPPSYSQRNPYRNPSPHRVAVVAAVMPTHYQLS